MKAYIYSSDELGLASMPSGLLRLEGAELTRNPEEADVFVCGPAVYVIGHAPQLWRMPFMRKYPERHVFLDVSDIYEAPIGMPCIFIRCNMRDHWWEGDPNSIPFAWPVENYAECVDLPADGFKYQVSFQAWNWSEVRKASAASCQSTSLQLDFALYDNFFGYLDDPNHPTYDHAEFLRRRAEYRRSMRESRVALCPESIPGVLPYRFFEAMSAARVPILVSSDYVLPFDDELPYDEFIVRIPSDQASRAGEMIQEFLRRTSDEQLISMGQKARAAWLHRLNAADWPAMMAYAVQKQLAKITCVSSS